VDMYKMSEGVIAKPCGAFNCIPVAT